jgi:hypothetical protein
VGHLSCHISLRKCSILTSVFNFIVWCCHICYHPQEDLATFGCKSNREIEVIQNPAIVWRPSVTYFFLNLATSLYRPAFLAKILQFLFSFSFASCHRKSPEIRNNAKFWPTKNVGWTQRPWLSRRTRLLPWSNNLGPLPWHHCRWWVLVVHACSRAWNLCTPAV